MTLLARFSKAGTSDPLLILQSDVCRGASDCSSKGKIPACIYQTKNLLIH
jgi:hypothetical protein